MRVWCYLLLSCAIRGRLRLGGFLLGKPLSAGSIAIHKQGGNHEPFSHSDVCWGNNRQRPQRRHRHGTAWPVVPTERRAPPSASYWTGRSQSQCAGAYTAAVGLVAQSHGAGRTKGRTGPHILTYGFCADSIKSRRPDSRWARLVVETLAGWRQPRSTADFPNRNSRRSHLTMPPPLWTRTRRSECPGPVGLRPYSPKSGGKSAGATKPARAPGPPLATAPTRLEVDR
jgi:hypothetical protein